MGSRIRSVLVLLAVTALVWALAAPAGAAVPVGKASSSGVYPATVFFANDVWEYAPLQVQKWDNTWQGAWTRNVPPAGYIWKHSFETSVASVAGGYYHGLPVDEDWSRFTLTAGHLYEFLAGPTSLVPGANPVIELFDAFGVTVDPPATDFLRWADDVRWYPGKYSTASLKGGYIAFKPKLTGTYYIRVVDDHHTGFQGMQMLNHLWFWSKKGVTYQLVVYDRGVTTDPFCVRPAALDRYELAASLARRGADFTMMKHVIVCCGQDAAAADALVAAGLAGVWGSPVLLTNKFSSTLPPPTKAIIQEIDAANGATNIQFHVIGGPASVPPVLLTALKAAAPGSTVERIGGLDRYQVAVNVAAKMRTTMGIANYPQKALFVNGGNPAYFWDAMMVGPIAYRKHYPILLTTSVGVPAMTTGAKAMYPIRYAVGQASSMPMAVSNALGGAIRIDNGMAGYDRQSQARYVAEWAEYNGWIGTLGRAKEFGVTNRLADSLVGGTFMGRRNGPLLFSRGAQSLDWDASSMPPWTAEYLMKHAVAAKDGGGAWIIGGSASVWPDVLVATGEYLGSNSVVP